MATRSDAAPVQPAVATAAAEPSPTTAEAGAGPLAASEPRADAAYLRNPPPVYPPMARRFGEEGKVVLRVFVEADGRPSRVEIKHSSGSPRLDSAAETAVWQWRFVAARLGDKDAAAWVQVPIVFNLKG